ncbi:SGNH/GDSL hydrolase family protein [Actinomadura sp. B10D3]|uniref:SGNH/GDSL hydrolase family protein n=1 Tax=Actinomadura sp. B10D3 TaxID=3153557 RepID=UPI00325ECFF9
MAMAWSKKRPKRALLGSLTVGILLTGTGGVTAPAEARSPAGTETAWTGGWSASVQRPSTGFEPNWSLEGFAGQSVRQVVRVSVGGSALRIRLSNRYGTTPLRVAGATVAVAGDGASVSPGTVRRLTFRRGTSAVIPAGTEILSNPAALRVGPLQKVTVTLYFAEATGPATFHAQAYATSYRADGNHLRDQGASAFSQTTHSWYYLSDVQVLGGRPARNTVVTLGDSITDGFGSTVDADNRYPDELAERFAAAGRPRSVLNAGIGGNLLLNDSAWYGESALARLRRDVLDEPGVKAVIVLVGTNDIGFSEVDEPTFEPDPDLSVPELVAGYRVLIARSRARGIRVVGGTVLPFKGSFYDTPRAEAKRTAINRWIRTSGEFDAVADFDRALADPADPAAIRSAYASADHLHPNDDGYRLMAEVAEAALR